MLANIPKKIKEINDLPRDIFAFSLIILLLVGSILVFALYTQSQSGMSAMRIYMQQTVESGSERGVLGASILDVGNYVGSKNGKTYHLPWCAGAQRIKDENKVWFETKEEAISRGYTPAGNCKGI